MKVAYSAPARDEVYAVSKNEARRIARSNFPDLSLLAFQTFHGPKMSSEVPYLATFTWQYIRILSIQPKYMCEDLKSQFAEFILPYICKTAKNYQDSGYLWPHVVVAIRNEIHQVACSEGWLFPSLNEVETQIRKHPHPICCFHDDKSPIDYCGK